MQSFHSFLSPEALDPFDSIEASDEFFSGVDELIYLWLKKYIEMYNPGFTFDEVVATINSVSVTDELI
jgi:hypothetical protein